VTGLGGGITAEADASATAAARLAQTFFTHVTISRNDAIARTSGLAGTEPYDAMLIKTKQGVGAEEEIPVNADIETVIENGDTLRIKICIHEWGVSYNVVLDYGDQDACQNYHSFGTTT
jgi:hypothetical protein